MGDIFSKLHERASRETAAGMRAQARAQACVMGLQGAGAAVGLELRQGPRREGARSPAGPVRMCSDRSTTPQGDPGQPLTLISSVELGKVSV